MANKAGKPRSTPKVNKGPHPEMFDRITALEDQIKVLADEIVKLKKKKTQ